MAELRNRERELQLMHDLAEEKVLSIEQLILRDDQKLFAANLPLGPPRRPSDPASATFDAEPKPYQWPQGTLTRH